MAQNEETVAEETEEKVTYTLPLKIELQQEIVTTNREGDVIDTKKDITIRTHLNAGMCSKLPLSADKQVMGDYLPILSKMTGETMLTINKLGFADLTKCLDVVTSFL